ncbi:helix-turn-helix transcriptional regulator [Arabiibacter massiliensis]|uniref:helix-turn-helix transcriptional regulator n=1 Tax=Arabiibacter massiliensis TaxID=1870985 RepID=UPI0009BA6F51|nr:LuxR family transcriptional regulator [Arabiibacter massiliensis]
MPASPASDAPSGSLDRLAARLEPPFPLRLLGFGLVYAWSTCVWDTEAIAGPAGGLSASPGATWLLSAVITPIAFLVFALAARKRDMLASRALAVAGPALSFAGTLLVALEPLAPEALRGAATVLGAVCTGIGPVALILLWINLYARLDLELIESAVPASFAMTLVITLFVPTLSDALSVAVVSLLPVASGALYLLSRRSYTGGELPAGDPPADERAAARLRPGTVARMFALLLASYSVGCLLPSIHPAGAPALLHEPWTASLGTLFAIALSVSIVLFSRRIDLDSLYRWIIAPFALAIIFAAFPNEACLALSGILGNATFTGLEIIMIIYFVRLANRAGKTPTLLIGLGECAAYTGVLIGFGGGALAKQAIAAGALDPKTAALALVGAFICSTLLVPRRDVAWSEGAPTPVIAASEVEGVVVAPAPESESFEARCARIAADRGLSAREAEIFQLLAQGRSQPYIRDMLYLSKNTVSTHTRHIYRKLDVHSKQELLDLLEE